MLTGNRNIDMKILNELEDEDLVRICSVNKKADKICKDQIFWMNRILLKFPEVPLNVLKKNKGNRTWSEYYINDLRILNKPNAYQYLYFGSMYGRLDHVIIAIDLGADIHHNHNDPVRMASLNGRLEVVKYLTERGANIHSVDNFAVRVASRQGHLEVVKYLVSQGADIHADNDLAVKLANNTGHSEVVDYLVSVGAPDPR